MGLFGYNLLSFLSGMGWKFKGRQKRVLKSFRKQNEVLMALMGVGMFFRYFLEANKRF